MKLGAACLKRPYFHTVIRTDGDHANILKAWFGSQLTRDVVTGNVWKVEIKHDHIWMEPLCSLNSGVSVYGELNLMTAPFDNRTHCLHSVEIGVHHQHAARSG